MIDPTPFTDWCADKLLEAEHVSLHRLPTDRYWAERDAGHEVRDRLEAALGRKVQINAR